VVIVKSRDVRAQLERAIIGLERILQAALREIDQGELRMAFKVLGIAREDLSVNFARLGMVAGGLEFQRRLIGKGVEHRGFR